MAIFPATLLGVLPVGCLLYMNGSLSAEDFLTVIVLSFGVMQPLLTAFSYTDDLAQVRTIVGDAADILEQEELKRPASAAQLPADSSIALEGVRFSYRDKEVLHGVSLNIQPGTVNALVGPSGSGKSTIARLIASLWDVKDGEIDLGGVDIRTLPLAECTKRIAYVSQDNYLFDLSVIDNIRMGKKGASDEEVIAAAKKCGCHEFIMGLENGYQTVCGASGGHLSGGERQRISIARAMLKDAPIILLDETTANVDPENEKELMEAVDELTHDKTVILIAHRLKTVRNADRIFVVDHGGSSSRAPTTSWWPWTAFTAASWWSAGRPQAGRSEKQRSQQKNSPSRPDPGTGFAVTRRHGKAQSGMIRSALEKSEGFGWGQVTGSASRPAPGPRRRCPWR